MLRTRVMPCLLLEGQGLVKTVRFAKPRYIGDAINSARIFNQMEVDELILLDIGATGSPDLQHELLTHIVSECFMPICYGGGVRTVADFRRVFRAGVEKVSVSRAAFEAPEEVARAVSMFGSQSVVATLDVRRGRFRREYAVHIDRGRRRIPGTLAEVVDRVAALGVGEIIVNNIDREGTWSGFDLDLVSAVSARVDVPVVAMGGAGTLNDIAMVVREAGASAVAIGSMAVMQAKEMGVLINFPTIRELEGVLP